MTQEVLGRETSMNVTFILLGIIGVVYGTLLVGIEFRKWRARIHCRVPVDAVFEKTVTKKMGDRVRTYALFSYHYQEKKFRQCTMERITRKEKKSLEKGKIYTIRINEENPKKLCYLRKNFQMEDLLTFMGAGGAAMRIMDQRMYNDMRNKTNRLSNCETANMGKTVQAAVQVRLAIEMLEEAGALETLPKPLQQAARLLHTKQVKHAGGVGAQVFAVLVPHDLAYYGIAVQVYKTHFGHLFILRFPRNCRAKIIHGFVVEFPPMLGIVMPACRAAKEPLVMAYYFVYPDGGVLTDKVSAKLHGVAP